MAVLQRDLIAIKPDKRRAIGVLYKPETERMSHYYFARLPEQFDALSTSITPRRSSRWKLTR